MYADIIIDIALKQLDRCFTYIVPPEMRSDIREGLLVSVPFGAGSRYVKGYVVKLSDTTDAPLEKLKYIDALLNDEATVDPNLLALAIKIKELYGGTLSQSLKVVFPVKKKVNVKKRELLVLSASEEIIAEKLELYERKHQVARLRLFNELLSQKEIPKDIATSKLNITSSVIKALVEQGVCEVIVKSEDKTSPIDNKLILNKEQQNIVDSVLADIENGKNDVSLIHGVTGSGKTEVYIEIVAGIVKSGKQAIVLIPEISLSYQTMMRFYKRFGERVKTLHSKLSSGEKYEIFEQAKAGEIDVVVGPRSALFTPFTNNGIIIIDEEHEGSYKSEKTPKYHAREIAKERAKLERVPLILGSATPSVDSYYNAKSGNYKLYKLSTRATGANLPLVKIVDLKEELKAGNKSVFSRELISDIDKRLNANEQVLLFINRRGYAGFVSCRNCGYVYKCDHCDVTMTLHGKYSLNCHYCGDRKEYRGICPECGSKYIGTMKSGTESIQLSLQEFFPEAKILRMDADTTSKKDAYEEILSAFANHEADILVGTQMIVKGHDFPDVTLVGILLADMSLYSSDYRSAERTFQMLTQCAGRAGRREKQGEVIIQTYSPKDDTIINAAAQDYEKFYEAEISYRALLDYPPTGHMLVILFEDAAEEYLIKFSERVYKVIDNSLYRFDDDVKLIGPASATLSYINDIYRRVIYIKASKNETLIDIKDALEKYSENLASKGEKVPSMQFDFDPMDGY